MNAKLNLATTSISATQYLIRISRFPWDVIAGDLDAYGAAVLPGLLSAEECMSADDLFADPSLSRTSLMDEQRAWSDTNNRYVRYPLPN